MKRFLVAIALLLACAGLATITVAQNGDDEIRKICQDKTTACFKACMGERRGVSACAECKLMPTIDGCIASGGQQVCTKAMGCSTFEEAATQR